MADLCIHAEIITLKLETLTLPKSSASEANLYGPFHAVLGQNPRLGPDAHKQVGGHTSHTHTTQDPVVLFSGKNHLQAQL